MKREKLLKNAFAISMIFLFVSIILTPFLVNRGISIFDEEILESFLLFALLFISLVLYFLYRNELNRREKQLTETLNYIGAVNLEIEQIRSVTDINTRYPENKKDFRFLFESSAKRALAGVNGDWVLLRIININSGQTLTEYAETRGAAVLLKYEVSNNDLLENKISQNYQAVASTQENLNIKVFCVMPVKSLDKNQEILLKAIVNNLSLLYLVLTLSQAEKRGI